MESDFRNVEDNQFTGWIPPGLSPHLNLLYVVTCTPYQHSWLIDIQANAAFTILFICQWLQKNTFLSLLSVVDGCFFGSTGGNDFSQSPAPPPPPYRSPPARQSPPARTTPGTNSSNSGSNGFWTGARIGGITAVVLLIVIASILLAILYFRRRKRGENMLDEEKASRGSWLRTFGSSAQQGMLHALLTNVLWYAHVTTSYTKPGFSSLSWLDMTFVSISDCHDEQLENTVSLIYKVLNLVVSTLLTSCKS